MSWAEYLFRRICEIRCLPFGLKPFLVGFVEASKDCAVRARGAGHLSTSAPPALDYSAMPEMMEYWLRCFRMKPFPWLSLGEVTVSAHSNGDCQNGWSNQRCSASRSDFYLTCQLSPAYRLPRHPEKAPIFQRPHRPYRK